MSITLVFILQSSGYGVDVTIQWKANEETEPDGYLIYYDVDSGEPYSPDLQFRASNDAAGPPISVAPSTTQFTLEDLSNDENYYIAIQAFNTYGDISPFSREVYVMAPNKIPSPYDRGWGVKQGNLEGFKVLFDSSDGVTPMLGLSSAIPAINLLGLTPVGVPLNLETSGVTTFNTPVTIFVPCPGHQFVDDLSIGLYDGNNWILACNEYGEIQPAAQGPL